VYEIRTSQEPIHAQVAITLHDHDDSRHAGKDDVVMKNRSNRAELLKTLDVQADGEYLCQIPPAKPEA
jgi:hypothetical protein